MNIQDELEHMRNLYMQINDMHDQLDTLICMVDLPANAISSIKSDGSTSRDMICTYVAESEQIVNEVVKRLAEIEKRYNILTELIYCLPHDQCRVIRARYVLGQRWKDIASAMSYSVRTCYRVHDYAINNLEKLAHNVT